MFHDALEICEACRCISVPCNNFKKQHKMITEEQVKNAQNEWGAGVVSIGSLKDSRTECEVFTSEFLDKLYAFEAGTVLFKPTKCAIEQFRPAKAQATSYFIAGEDRACEEDTGFAIAPWTKVRFENAGMILEETRAIAMGNYFFTDVDGNEVKVEYTFGYRLNDANQFSIDHQS
ncbi:MAG: hypothetical protein AAFO94_10675, partial [Bacteroidota bacterium]